MIEGVVNNGGEARLPDPLQGAPITGQNGDAVPLMDQAMNLMRTSTMPSVRPDISYSLNTLEPSCCKDWKVVDYQWIAAGGAPNYIGQTEVIRSLVQPIGPGVADNQRIGNTIHLHCLLHRFVIVPNDPTTTLQTARMIIAYDKQSNCTSATPTLSLVSSPHNLLVNGFLTADQPLAFTNRNWRQRYDVLYDRLFECGQTAITPNVNNTTQTTDVCWSMIPLNNRIVEYDNGGFVKTGDLCVAHIGTAAVTVGHLLKGFARVFYSEVVDDCT